MKILFISHSAVLKYHQQKLEILAEQFGHEIHLICPPYWNEGGVRTELYKGSSRIKYTDAGAVVIKSRMMHFYKNALRCVKEINPDIIHIEEEPFNAPCYQFVKAARQTDTKVMFFTWENMERKHNPVYSYFEKFCIENCICAISGNEEGKTVLEKKGFKGEVFVIPQYGLNMDDFFPTAHEPGAAVNVSFIGRVTYEKGVDLILSAVKNVENVNVNIAGSEDKEYADTLRKYVRENNMESRVVFKGHMGTGEIPEFLLKSDILILPSRTMKTWKEQFGRVLIEAFASRTAVIGSSSGEIPNVIGDAGLIFRENDAVDLYEKLNSIIEDREKMKDMIEKGYQRVSERYTNSKIAESIDAVYRSLQ